MQKILTSMRNRLMARLTRPRADDGLLDTPMELHVNYLANVTRDDAEAYVIGYIRNKTVSENVFYGIFPFKNGFIFEIHEGGSGHAYIPTLLERIEFSGKDGEFRGILLSSRKKIQVSHSEREFSVMAIPQDRDVRAAVLIEPSDHSLKQLHFNHAFQMLVVASFFCAISAGVLIYSGLTRQEASEIYLQQVETTQLPLYRLLENEKIAVNEEVTSIKFEEGQWSIEKKQVGEPARLDAPVEVPPEDSKKIGEKK